jgi:Putative zinc-finger
MSHISDDDLARYLEGDLRPRRSAKIRSHLAGCSGCQDRVAALQAVPNLLASAQFPPIPERLSSRIQMALASESSARVASAPASEAGRRDLPGRARPGRQRPRMPKLTSPAGLRTVAAVGAAVVIAGGGYALVSHIGSGSSSTSESITAPSAAPAKLQNGPAVSYRHAGRTHSIKTVKSGVNFKPTNLASQARLALAAQQKSASSRTARNNGSMSTFGASASTNQTFPNSSAPTSTTRLQGCVDRIAAGRIVLLVDSAKFQGSPATIIVVSSGTSAQAEVYAAGSGCSVSASDILGQQVLYRS